MSCTPTREWLHRETSSLDEAQRLLLDDHLAACSDCRGDRERLRLVREVGTALPVPPAGAREYSRAIARALLEGSRAETPAPRRWTWLAPACAGVAAAAIALVVVARDEAKLAVPEPRIAVHVGPDESQVSKLQVAIADGSTYHWSGDRELVLDAGKAEIETVEQLRIITERFEVELANASVVVEPTTVRVRRGSARIVDREQNQLAQIEAGSVWQPEIEMSPMVAKRPEKKPKLIVQARVELAAGHQQLAEQIAETLLASQPSRRDEAEARMFLAELAQGAGQLDVAIERYDLVATKFADLPAAESALYAAARLEMRRGRADAARTLFDRYLDRYPAGRYADDVRQRRSPR